MMMGMQPMADGRQRRGPWLGAIAAVAVIGVGIGVWFGWPRGQAPPPAATGPRVEAHPRRRAPAPTLAEISGQVVDPDGQAVPAALVTLSGRADETGASILRAYRTRAGGLFRFQGLPPGGYRLQAR